MKTKIWKMLEGTCWWMIVSYMVRRLGSNQSSYSFLDRWNSLLYTSYLLESNILCFNLLLKVYYLCLIPFCVPCRRSTFTESWKYFIPGKVWVSRDTGFWGSAFWTLNTSVVRSWLSFHFLSICHVLLFFLLY